MSQTSTAFVPSRVPPEADAIRPRAAQLHRPPPPAPPAGSRRLRLRARAGDRAAARPAEKQTGTVRLLGNHAPIPMPMPTCTLTPEGRSAQAGTSEKTLRRVCDPKDDRPAKLETARQGSEALSDEGEEDS